MMHQDWTHVTFNTKQKREGALPDNKTIGRRQPRQLATQLPRDRVHPVKTISREFSDSIRNARNSQEMTQGDLAKSMNLPLSVVKSYENGTAIYNGQLIERFNLALNLE
jgi:ribosome-binding protein aMBF1 (putative translation factor)